MRLSNIIINNFRGIKHCCLNVPPQIVLVGDNNSGKSTILEAIDLVLGPERLSRRPVIDEHDFYAGNYLNADKNSIEIKIVATIIGLNEEQKTHFRNNLEWWDDEKQLILSGPPPEQTDATNVIPALRVGFRGFYDAEEDDFFGKTYFLSPAQDDGTLNDFTSRDKRLCGFLYLRTLRTGSRALSLEKGSLLDIILKLRELKPQMWEDVLRQLREVSVASDPTLGISSVLESVQNAIREFVPVEYADAPAIRVSQMTREHLRHILTVFLDTGAQDESGNGYAAPFNRQGTGTINTLVLTLLSMIAELKQNVIFAMEEPEIAIPPHTQKSVIKSVSSKAAQAIFTSHSPYVLEEFNPEHIVVVSRKAGILTGIPATYPPKIKSKAYREETRKRCEALLARRVLVVEGRTEYDVFSRVAEKLQEIEPGKYTSLESLGIAVINAGTDTQIAPLGNYFRNFGKTVYAIFDKQKSEDLQTIIESIDYAYESDEKGFENLVVKNVGESALRRHTKKLIDNGHLSGVPLDNIQINDLRNKMKEYFIGKKGEGAIADFLEDCSINEIPDYIKDTLHAIHNSLIPPNDVSEEDLIDVDENTTTAS